MKRERVTEIIVKTVALRTVVDVAVEQDTVALVANKVRSDCLISRSAKLS